jgi:hypothetical protein
MKIDADFGMARGMARKRVEKSESSQRPSPRAFLRKT